MKRLLSSWGLFFALCFLVFSAKAVPLHVGDSVMIIISSKVQDTADLDWGEGEYFLITTSGGFSTQRPLTNGGHQVPFTVSVPNETVSVIVVGYDGDETFNVRLQVTSPSDPPPPPPPAPPPEPPPLPEPPPPPPPPEPDPGPNGGPPCNGVKNPIDAMTGNKFQHALDFKGGGNWPMTFQRYYNSSPWNIGVKPGWHHNYDFTADLRLTGAANGSSTILVHLPHGRAVTYVATSMNGADYVWTSNNDPAGALLSSAGRYWYIEDNNTVYAFEDKGLPQTNGVTAGTVSVLSIQAPSGYLQTLSYRDGGLLAIDDPSVFLMISDSFGRKISMSDNGTATTSGDRSPRWVSLPDSDDYSYRLGFKNRANNVGWFIANQFYDSFPYGQSYLYGEASLAPANLPYVLTGVVDANGNRFASYGYEASGRAVLTQHAGGTYSASLVFKTDGSTQVTDSNGTVTFGRAMRNGIAKNAGASQPAGAGCAAANSASDYDAKGNLNSQDDFNGHRTCFQNDAGRNLELSRVEGLATTASCSAVVSAGASLPAGSRKVTTQWHPSWRLKSRVAAPSRITSYVYNGQTDPSTGQTVNCVTSTYGGTTTVRVGVADLPLAVLCRKTERATTDVDGHFGFSASADLSVPLRSWNYTYTELGQILTETDPSNNKKTYAYHLTASNSSGLGDLKSMTDAKGKVTQYTDYDGAGRLLQMVDPNGLVIQYQYQAPGRLVAVKKYHQEGSSGGMTWVTRYKYDAEGQLIGVTDPDGSYTGYEYDLAHRQVAVFDNSGNRIEYTLDNEGNRVATRVKDSAGNLARTQSRAIDALGRVQQTTGRQ